MKEFILEQFNNLSTLSDAQVCSVVFLCGVAFLVSTLFTAIMDFFGERYLNRCERIRELKRISLSSDD